jgi:hypothetical protein
MVKASLAHFIECEFILICVNPSILSYVSFGKLVVANIQVLLNGTKNQEMDELFEGESLILLVWKPNVLVKNETLALFGQ